MNTKFWFATDIKTIVFFVYHKNYGRIEIVGILLARLNICMAVKMSTYKLSGCCKKKY